MKDTTTTPLSGTAMRLTGWHADGNPTDEHVFSSEGRGLRPVELRYPDLSDPEETGNDECA